jgi:hypothetical protein
VVGAKGMPIINRDHKPDFPPRQVLYRRHAVGVRTSRTRVPIQWQRAAVLGKGGLSMNHEMRVHIMTSIAPASPNGSAPHCEHADRLTPVAPRSRGCPACEAHGAVWTALRICLTCGWVACSDDSPHRHAQAHYQETDHPVAAAMGPGSTWRWCYVHERRV